MWIVGDWTNHYPSLGVAWSTLVPGIICNGCANYSRTITIPKEGEGSTKLLLATLLPLDWSVIRYFRASIVHPEYCIVLEQLHVPRATRQTKNPAGKQLWSNCSKSFELRAGNRYEKKDFSFKNFLLLWKYEKIWNLDTTNRRIIGERINPINDRKIDRG